MVNTGASVLYYYRVDCKKVAVGVGTKVWWQHIASYELEKDAWESFDDLTMHNPYETYRVVIVSETEIHRGDEING
jgi:hypothetical protein